MERGRLWTSSFRINVGVLERNLTGLTDELAATRPAEGLGCPAWVLGHLVRSRHGIMVLAGNTQVEANLWAEHYGRGTDGGRAHLPMSQLVEAFKGTDEAMKETFRAVTDWDKPTLNPGLKQEQPLEQVVAFLFWHEGYHMGQIALARKLYGLGGAV